MPPPPPPVVIWRTGGSDNGIYLMYASSEMRLCKTQRTIVFQHVSSLWKEKVSDWPAAERAPEITCLSYDPRSARGQVISSLHKGHRQNERERERKRFDAVTLVTWLPLRAFHSPQCMLGKAHAGKLTVHLLRGITSGSCLWSLTPTQGEVRMFTGTKWETAGRGFPQRYCLLSYKTGFLQGRGISRKNLKYIKILSVGLQRGTEGKRFPGFFSTWLLPLIFNYGRLQHPIVSLVLDIVLKFNSLRSIKVLNLTFKTFHPVRWFQKNLNTSFFTSCLQINMNDGVKQSSESDGRWSREPPVLEQMNGN